MHLSCQSREVTRAAEVCRGSRSGPGLVALLSLNRTHVPLGGEEEEGRRGGEPKDVTRWVSGVPPMGPSSVIQRMYKQGPSGRGKASLGASLEETANHKPQGPPVPHLGMKTLQEESWLQVRGCRLWELPLRGHGFLPGPPTWPGPPHPLLSHAVPPVRADVPQG